MRIALDTNILVYAEGVNGPELQQQTLRVLRRVPVDNAVLPVQVLGELFVVLRRKAKWPYEAAHRAIVKWRGFHPTLATTEQTVFSAAELVGEHSFSFWDAVIVAVSQASGCRILLSEDMQDGFSWHGLTIVNPLAPQAHPLIAGLLRDTPRSPASRMIGRRKGLARSRIS